MREARAPLAPITPQMVLTLASSCTDIYLPLFYYHVLHCVRSSYCSLTMSPRFEVELHLALIVVDSVSWLLVIGVYVSEPSDTSLRLVLQILAFVVEDGVVVLWRGIRRD